MAVLRMCRVSLPEPKLALTQDALPLLLHVASVFQPANCKIPANWTAMAGVQEVAHIHAMLAACPRPWAGALACWH